MEALETYKEYINGLTKKQLVELLIGDNDVAPLLTRNEPSYSRPQILWGINKLNKSKKIGLKYSEADTMQILDYIERLKYSNFYFYDWFTFEVKKPSFSIFMIFLFLAGFGFVVALTKIVNWIL